MTINIKENFHIIPVGALEENCIIVKCPETGYIGIFDPGDESEKIISFIKSIGGRPLCIINTHCHYDHIGAVKDIKNEFNVPFLVHEAEMEYSVDPEKNLSSVSGIGYKIEPDGLFREDDVLKIGNLNLKVLHTPGHTLGSCCFLFDGVLISGDTLFAGSVGRTDLYGGNSEVLIRSVREKLAILDNKTVVIPGHGRTTRIKDEKWFNPFMQF